MRPRYGYIYGVIDVHQATCHELSASFLFVAITPARFMHSRALALGSFLLCHLLQNLICD